MASASQIKTILRERKGESGTLLQYVQLPTEKRVRSVEPENSIQLRGFIQLLRSIFLPQGYPSSVSEDYLEYQIWDTIQAFCSSLSGSLSTRAVLEGVGVGSTASTPLAATIMWLIKDGTGMVGRILFAWCNGAQLDADSKKWRFFADVLNDCALTLELAAPYAVAAIGGSSRAMTAVLCIAGTAKSIVGVAGGATRAALTQHQARQGNLADVSAKDGSQETLVNLAALVTSLWLLPLLDGAPNLTWSAFLLLTLMHVFANFKAVKAVTMQTLNRTRYLAVIKRYAATQCVPTVKDINQEEPVVMGLIPSEERECGYRIKLGASIRSVVSDELEDILASFKDKNYAIMADESTKTMYILLRQESTDECMLESYAFAVFASLRASGFQLPWLHSKVALGNAREALQEIMQSNTWENFRKGLIVQGWNLKQSLLAPGEWRAFWGDSSV